MPITRQRSVTPDAFLNPRLLPLPPEVRLTEIGLRLYADNHGRERAMSRLLLATLFPLDQRMTETDMDRHLLMLDEAGAIALYDVAGETFYQVLDWPAVQHPGKSNIPEAPADAARPFMKPSGTAHGEGEGERERERESEGESERESPPHDPTSPPSPFCPAHRATGGTDQPCRKCGRARMQRKVWDDQQIRGSGEADDEPF